MVDRMVSGSSQTSGTGQRVKREEQSARAHRIIDWFEALRPDTLDSIATVYGPNARFRDPFNDVSGLRSIRQIYAHMFESLENPRFTVTESVEQASHLCVVWMFQFSWRGRPIEFEGTTWFDLDERGLISRHRDFWDVSQGVYERLPVLGTVLRVLRRKMATPGLLSDA
ncbi:nuclear transport factor 2 family protein [Orrella marina]|uniref:SnoaL-like domain-containing protein n=1 Tax=Orrella marina TaxID=2163011 RepID=A0A2R4XGQ9_9BURK|nr:nuclear transport factor 2 family protein [Orrella marina]AWB32873.1 hypothetical protein DBV39_03115 [Orrella marina]